MSGTKDSEQKKYSPQRSTTHPRSISKSVMRISFQETSPIECSLSEHHRPNNPRWRDTGLGKASMLQGACRCSVVSGPPLHASLSAPQSINRPGQQLLLLSQPLLQPSRLLPFTFLPFLLCTNWDLLVCNTVSIIFRR